MSQLLSIMLNVISPVMIIAGIGFLMGRWLKLNGDGLSTLLVYVFVPSLVFRGIATTRLSGGELSGMAAMVVLTALVMIAAGFGAARLLSLHRAEDRKLQSAFIMCIVLVNAGNYGVPLNAFAFGAEGEERALVFYVMTAMISNVIGVYFASRGTLSTQKALANVLRVPITYAALLGLIVNLLSFDQPMQAALWRLLPHFGHTALPGTLVHAGFMLPLPISRSVELLANAAIPGMLVLLGLKLAELRTGGHWRAIWAAVSIKLVFAPLLAFPLALLLGLTGVTFKVAVIQVSMPTAVIANALASQFDGDAQFTAAVTVVSTLASIVSLSVLLVLLGTQL